MQQTDKYKLNLIERDDVFSPDALNENAEKIEAHLDAIRQKEEDEVTALDARVTALEVKKIAVGIYTGKVTTKFTVPLEFTPRLVVAIGTANNSTGSPSGFITEEVTSSYNGSIVTNGFSPAPNGALNQSGYSYLYFAFA